VSRACDKDLKGTSIVPGLEIVVGWSRHLQDYNHPQHAVLALVRDTAKNIDPVTT